MWYTVKQYEKGCFFMHKLLVFDLDGTLAPVGKAMSEETVAMLKQLEAKGHIIVLCSGKPTYYLCGMLRQVGLESPWMIGENGSVFQQGVDLPPVRFEIYPFGQKAKEQLALLRKRIDEAWQGALWYQPNEVAVTPFPYEEACFERIQEVLDAHPEDVSELAVYRHGDCFDVLPKCISKAEGVKHLVELLGLTAEDVAAFGDGSNDLPMFAYAHLSVGIGDGVKGMTDLHFDRIEDALAVLMKE